MDYQRVLEGLAEAFIERPLDFLLVQNLQTRAAEALRNEIRNEDDRSADSKDGGAGLIQYEDGMYHPTLPSEVDELLSIAYRL